MRLHDARLAVDHRSDCVCLKDGARLLAGVHSCRTLFASRRSLQTMHAGSWRFAALTKRILSKFEIPLPPLEVQKEIVAEIEGYQKVIDGARAVLDHYRPHIPIHPEWPMVELEDACDIQRGKLSHRPVTNHASTAAVSVHPNRPCRPSERRKITIHADIERRRACVSKALPAARCCHLRLRRTSEILRFCDFPSCFPDSVVGLIPKP